MMSFLSKLGSSFSKTQPNDSFHDIDEKGNRHHREAKSVEETTDDITTSDESAKSCISFGKSSCSSEDVLKSFASSEESLKSAISTDGVLVPKATEENANKNGTTEKKSVPANGSAKSQQQSAKTNGQKKAPQTNRPLPNNGGYAPATNGYFAHEMMVRQAQGLVQAAQSRSNTSTQSGRSYVTTTNSATSNDSSSYIRSRSKNRTFHANGNANGKRYEQKNHRRDSDNDKSPQVVLPKSLRDLHIPPEAYCSHPLQSKWVLWYLKGDRNKDWEDCLQQVTMFDTVEKFWGLYMKLQCASGLNWSSDYYLFKEGIKPMWEDESNVKGGRWLVVIDKAKRAMKLDQYWLDLILAMIGGEFEPHNDFICGAVVNVRQKGDKISLWTQDSLKDDTNLQIGHVLKKQLDIPDTEAIRYEVHKDASVRTGSMVKPRIVLPMREVPQIMIK
jgi:translation initiation factor 4E